MADAYFEVGKQVTLPQPAAALVRREPEERGASIIVRSEPSPPALPIGPSPILIGAERAGRSSVKIGWDR